MCFEGGRAVSTRPLLPKVYGDKLEYIETTDGVRELAERARNASVLAIDTEFIREKTYYPKLCLLQLATDEQVWIIDPFKAKDLSALVPLLLDGGITKLFHAAKQDIEIIYHLLDAIPAPIFDTQVAAALLGRSFQIGLAALVQSYCGVSLKKGDSFTDWARRPLSKSQLDYAVSDVIYLPDIYRKMKAELEALGRTTWMDNDLDRLSDISEYRIDPYTRYLHLKRANQLSPRQLSAAKEVAAWREIKAQELDVPRKWVLSDEQIVEACRKETKTIDDLFLIRGIRGHISTKDARKIAELINYGISVPECDYPHLPYSNTNEKNVDASLDLMQALVRLRAKENDIAMQILAPHSDLTAVARGHLEGLDVMSGWRRKIVGDELLDLLDGKINLSLSDGSLIVSKC